MTRAKTAFLVLVALLAAATGARAQQFRFHLQEATIDDVHRAIREGQITCRDWSSSISIAPKPTTASPTNWSPKTVRPFRLRPE